MTLDPVGLRRRDRPRPGRSGGRAAGARRPAHRGAQRLGRQHRRPRRRAARPAGRAARRAGDGASRRSRRRSARSTSRCPVEHEVERLGRADRAPRTGWTPATSGCSRSTAREGVAGRGHPRRRAACGCARWPTLAEAARTSCCCTRTRRTSTATPRSACLDIVESVGSAALRVAWDSANFVQVGVAPRSPTATRCCARTWSTCRSRTPSRRPAGRARPARGDGELRETLTALRDDGYAGFASLEPHLADVQRPRRLLRAARPSAAPPGRSPPHRRRSESTLVMTDPPP